MPLPTSSRQINAFKCSADDGFENWRKAFERLHRREKSDLHRAANSMAKSMGKQPVTQMISSGHTNQMKQNRVALIKIFTSLRYLGMQAIAIRGKPEEESNLMTLLNERKDDVEELVAWLKRKEKFKWLSPEILTEILTDFSHAILRELRDKVLNAIYHGIILDETSDISTKRQINSCFRIVQEDFLVEEQSFGFYQTSITSSDVLYAIVQDVLLQFQFSIKKCRGQCYDGAATVSGHVTGLRTKIFQEKSHATYVHCRAHKLNLAVQDALKSNNEIRNVMGMINLD